MIDILLPGEEEVLRKNANAIVVLSDYGLTPQYRAVMDRIGWKGDEAIGGQLRLTTYRLIFKAHAINRVQGWFGIFLPTIWSMHDRSGMLTKKLEINTRSNQFRFVVWGIPAFMAEISRMQSRLPAAGIDLSSLILANLDKIGPGLDTLKAKQVERAELAQELVVHSIASVLGLHAITAMNLLDFNSSLPADEHRVLGASPDLP